MKIKFFAGIDVGLYIEGELVLIISSATRQHGVYIDVTEIITQSFTNHKPECADSFEIRYDDGDTMDATLTSSHELTIFDPTKTDPDVYYNIVELYPIPSV